MTLTQAGRLAENEADDVAVRLVAGKSVYFETLYAQDALNVTAQCLSRGAEVHISRTALGGYHVEVPWEDET